MSFFSRCCFFEDWGQYSKIYKYRKITKHSVCLLCSPVMEPGWSPLPTDAQPYFQVDFLEPTWISGLVTQGSERMKGYLTKYRLAFALHSSVFTDYTENGKPGGPAKVFVAIWIYFSHQDISVFVLILILHYSWKNSHYTCVFLVVLQVFEVRMFSRTPVTRWLDRLVRARYLRILPMEFRHTFYLRVEIIGCRGGIRI